jgi:hypothetical protein
LPARAVPHTLTGEYEFRELPAWPRNKMPINPNKFLPVVILAVVALRVYGRVRRNIGRQPLQPKRLKARIAIYAVVTLLLVAVSITISPRMLIGLGSGLALGALLALAGLRLTRFETVAEGRFYTPNLYFGAGLSILLVARLGYRLMVLSDVSQDAPAPPGLMQSALTFCVVGLLAGYYMAYFTGVLARSRTASN